MYIIVTEPLNKDIKFDSKTFEEDNINWFEAPVIRQDRNGKSIIKKVIVRHIDDTEFISKFKLDRKTIKKYIHENLKVHSYLRNKYAYLDA